MTIKHIVLPGGGAAGFTIIGVLDELYRQKAWEYEDLESIMQFPQDRSLQFSLL